MFVSPAVFLHALGTGAPLLTSSTAQPGIPISEADVESVTQSADQQLSRRAFADGSPLRDQLRKERVSASGYHLATRDHPFLDMSKGLVARVEDAKLMADYLAETDKYPPVHTDVPNPGRAVELPHAIHLGLDELRVRDDCKLALILGGTFGKTGHQMPYYDPVTGYHQVEVLRKSVPSGGSRHPTECFLEVLRAPSSLELSPGWYHFATRTNALVATAPMRQDEGLTLKARKSSADFVMCLHLHTIVERAMFRYRDPRSMRALFVDAGHADAQMEALAAYCNWSYESNLSLDTAFKGPSDELNGETAPKLLSGILEGWAVE